MPCVFYPLACGMINELSNIHLFEAAWSCCRQVLGGEEDRMAIIAKLLLLSQDAEEQPGAEATLLNRGVTLLYTSTIPAQPCSMRAENVQGSRVMWDG
eukprot:4323074-Amphidinium_carterae.1